MSTADLHCSLWESLLANVGFVVLFYFCYYRYACFCFLCVTSIIYSCKFLLFLHWLYTLIVWCLQCCRWRVPCTSKSTGDDKRWQLRWMAAEKRRWYEHRWCASCCGTHQQPLHDTWSPSLRPGRKWQFTHETEATVKHHFTCRLYMRFIIACVHVNLFTCKCT